MFDLLIIVFLVNALSHYSFFFFSSQFSFFFFFPNHVKVSCTGFPFERNLSNATLKIQIMSLRPNVRLACVVL
jgi:hypothetical protein